jgi:hypothetical protein|tara:strand:- start:201 stop:401 length:201 start_codon:yes stop_codon:yes gene_type:complete
MSIIKLTLEEAKTILTRQEPKHQKDCDALVAMEKEGFVVSSAQATAGRKGQFLVNLREELEAYGEL